MLEKGVIVDPGAHSPHGALQGHPGSNGQALLDGSMHSEGYEAEIHALRVTVDDVSEENAALKARLAEFEGTIREQEAAILELAGTTATASTTAGTAVVN